MTIDSKPLPAPTRLHIPADLSNRSSIKELIVVFQEPFHWKRQHRSLPLFHPNHHIHRRIGLPFCLSRSICTADYLVYSRSIIHCGDINKPPLSLSVITVVELEGVRTQSKVVRPHSLASSHCSFPVEFVLVRTSSRHHHRTQQERIFVLRHQCFDLNLRIPCAQSFSLALRARSVLFQWQTFGGSFTHFHPPPLHTFADGSILSSASDLRSDHSSF